MTAGKKPGKWLVHRPASSRLFVAASAPRDGVRLDFSCIILPFLPLLLFHLSHFRTHPLCLWSPLPLRLLQHCLGPLALLPIIPGKSILPVIQRPLQKIEGHPKLRRKKHRFPKGAWVGSGGDACVALTEEECAYRTRTRAAQASPPPIHTTPAPTGNPRPSSFFSSFFLHLTPIRGARGDAVALLALK